MIDSAENRNLSEQTVTNFGTKMLFLNLFNGDNRSQVPMPWLPHYGERTRTDFRPQYVVTDQAAIFGA